MKTLKTFLTLRGLAQRTGVPIATAQRRVRELGISPDGITVEKSRPSTWLFDTKRLPKLRQLLKPTTVQEIL